MEKEFRRKVEREIFSLALYTQASPVTKGRLLIHKFPSLNKDFLDWAYQGQLTLDQKLKYNAFKRNLNLHQEFERNRKEGVKWISIFSPYYPQQLKHSYGAPLLLFYKGNINLLLHEHLGVVGSRLCTRYGLNAINQLLPKLIEAGISVVSGVAKGIDTQAHRVAINLKGNTVGVIGCGLDVVYPRENVQLYNELIENHLLISEYPLGTKPIHYHFPQRNRIIAGLSRGVLIVEAKQKSGSLITARQALEEGREVFAVPGSIFSETSKGCHELILQGAKLTLSTESILEEFLYI